MRSKEEKVGRAISSSFILDFSRKGKKEGEGAPMERGGVAALLLPLPLACEGKEGERWTCQCMRIRGSETLFIFYTS